MKATIGAGDVIRGMSHFHSHFTLPLGRSASVYEAAGWDEGVPQMSLGEKAILTMSGYGFLPLALLLLLLGL